jgi:hypothetical protein
MYYITHCLDGVCICSEPAGAVAGPYATLDEARTALPAVSARDLVSRLRDAFGDDATAAHALMWVHE